MNKISENNKLCPKITKELTQRRRIIFQLADNSMAMDSIYYQESWYRNNLLKLGRITTIQGLNYGVVLKSSKCGFLPSFTQMQMYPQISSTYPIVKSLLLPERNHKATPTTTDNHHGYGGGWLCSHGNEEMWPIGHWSMLLYIVIKNNVDQFYQILIITSLILWLYYKLCHLRINGRVAYPIWWPCNFLRPICQPSNEIQRHVQSYGLHWL